MFSMQTIELAARILIGVMWRLYVAVDPYDLDRERFLAAWRLVNYFGITDQDRAEDALEEYAAYFEGRTYRDEISRALAILNAGRLPSEPVLGPEHLVSAAARLVAEVPREDLRGIGAVQDTDPARIAQLAALARPVAVSR